MAGIGFELRRILKRRTYFSLLKAYGFAGIVSSGPWLLSIFGILLLGFLAVSQNEHSSAVIDFQVSVTYLIMSSLIFTGPVQLLFTRYIADMLFARQKKGRYIHHPYDDRRHLYPRYHCCVRHSHSVFR